MANELNLPYHQTGLTVTAVLIQANAAVGAAISCPESGTVPGHYSGNMPIISAGLYGVRFLSAGVQIGTGIIYWDGTAERTILNLPTVAQVEARTLLAADYFNPNTDPVATVTSLTNAVVLPAIPTNWITAAGVAADAVVEIQSGLLTSASHATSLPANFNLLGINSSGHLSRVTLVDTTTTNTDMRGTNGALTSVGNVMVGGYAIGQSPADLVTGFATPANVSDVQSAIINHGNSNWVTATGFLTTLSTNAPANWINATSLTNDAIIEIQSGLATSASIAAIPTNPLLANDIRLNNLDATISSRSDFDASIESVIVGDKTGFSLSSGGVQAIWNALTSALTTNGSVGKFIVDQINILIGRNNPLNSTDTQSAVSAAITAANLYNGSDTPGTTTLLTRITGLLPTKTEIDLRTLPSADYATSASLVTVDSVVDGIAVQTTRFNTLIENIGGDRFTAKALEAAPSGSGSGDSAAAIYTYFTSLDREDVFKADVTGLSTFNANTDSVTVNSVPNSAGISTLLTRITADRATYLDKLNVAGTLSNTSNAATFRADLTSLSAAVALIPTNPLLATSYVAPDNASIGLIKAKTDLLTFTGTDLQATLDGEEVVISTAGVNAIIAGVNGALTIPHPSDIRIEMDNNSTQLAAIKTIATVARNNAAAGI